jgi:3-hydroxybutyryl-CoA dehydrogenase
MKYITVIGSGTMGNGIAHIFAQYGFQVALVDIKQEALDRGIETISKNLDRQINKGLMTHELKQETLSRINTFTNIKEGLMESDLVIEAATEDVNIKLSIFKELDRFCKPEAILASNTSSISITKIGSVTRRPDKVIGMHFMNPVPVITLVEIIRGYSTSDKTNSQILELAKKLEKIPVETHDYPGFVANRILMPMINEAIYTYYEGVAGIQEIDEIMKLGMAHPMGPLQLADFIGLDVCLSILRVLHEGFGNPKYAPCPLLVNMVNANKLGKKTGEGFYKY